MKPLYGEEEDYRSISVSDQRSAEMEKKSSEGMGETDADQRIREYFGQQTDKELRMEIGDMSFTLIRIHREDSDTMEQFCPYCDRNPEGKYGVIWKAWPIQDRYVFDMREYAVDFIVMSRKWE